jgi:hypothetical protein
VAYTRVDNRQTGIGDVGSKIIITLDAGETVGEILLCAMSIAPRGDSRITLSHTLPVRDG